MSGVIFPVTVLQREASYLVSTALMIFWTMVRLSTRVSKYIVFVRRCISSMLGIWTAVPDGFRRIWWLSEWIGRIDTVILCRREYNVELAIIDAFQGSWDRTSVGFELIFELVECLICRFPADFGLDRVLKVGVFVVDGGGQLHDSSLSSFARGFHKSNTKLSLVELWTTRICAVSY